jgi:hypothetical protein
MLRPITNQLAVLLATSVSRLNLMFQWKGGKCKQFSSIFLWIPIHFYENFGHLPFSLTQGRGCCGFQRWWQGGFGNFRRFPTNFRVLCQTHSLPTDTQKSMHYRRDLRFIQVYISKILVVQCLRIMCVIKQNLNMTPFIVMLAERHVKLTSTNASFLQFKEVPCRKNRMNTSQTAHILGLKSTFMNCFDFGHGLRFSPWNKVLPTCIVIKL